MTDLPVTWRGWDDPGRIDHAVLRLGTDGMSGHGTSVSADHALSWSLDATAGWVTRTLAVTVHGDGWMRSLLLARADDGTWTGDTTTRGDADLPSPGLVDREALRGALDCDLGLCPATNTMPIRRLGLLDADVPDTSLVMAWVEVPSLRVIRSDQVYGSAGPGRVRYRSYSRDFHAELTVDEHGVVLDYPGLARRIV